MLATQTRIELELACDGSICDRVSMPLHRTLRRGYDVCSVMELPESLEAWRAEHRTARKRADRAARLGYEFSTVQAHLHTEDLYAINVSLDERQGRPMAPGYRVPPSPTPDPPYTCPRHAIRRYGVLSGSRLVAYLWLYRSGELALVSSILGHGDHLRDDVMYLLVQGVVEREIDAGGFLVYNRHDSGTDGLRFFKERLGFRPVEVEWAP